MSIELHPSLHNPKQIDGSKIAGFNDVYRTRYVLHQFVVSYCMSSVDIVDSFFCGEAPSNLMVNYYEIYIYTTLFLTRICSGPSTFMRSFSHSVLPIHFDSKILYPSHLFSHFWVFSSACGEASLSASSSWKRRRRRPWCPAGRLAGCPSSGTPRSSGVERRLGR